MTIAKLLPKARKNISLAKYAAFKIGGRAKYFFSAENKKELILAVRTAKKLKLPFFVLGGGSNLLVSDKGFSGLVVKIQNTKYEIQNTKITAGAGTLLGELVREAAKTGLTGLEWAVGIPGTVGGAVFGNTGAFGMSMEDITKIVTVLEIKNQKSKIKNFKNKDCKFGYRDSIFKKNRNLVILSIVLEFKKSNKKIVQNKIKKFLDYRKSTQPLNSPSAGSVFKNAESGQKSIPAAWLIEKCGLKGRKIGGAVISEKHANFIVNSGGAKAGDVIKLIKLIKKKVKNKFKIELKEEIQYLGFSKKKNF